MSESADDSDTPPPYRSKSEYDLKIPIDSEWFHGWRKDVDRMFKEIRVQFAAIDSRMHDGSLSLFKHDEQITTLAKDMAGTDIEQLAMRSRIEQLEKREDKRTDREITDTTGLGAKIKEIMILSGAAGLVGGLGLFLWFLVTLYVKAKP